MSRELELEDNEIVRASMKCYREVSNTELVLNFLTNMFVANQSLVAAGEIVSEYIVTLTDKNLYLEGIYHVQLGGLPEGSNLSKIPLKNVEDFIVQEKGKEELVTILVNKGKNLKLIHKNNGWTNDAMKIKELYF